MTVLRRYNLELTNIFSVVKDGAPIMVRKRRARGFDEKQQEDLPLMHYHCVVHQQNFCAKFTNIDEMMKMVVKLYASLNHSGSTTENSKNV